MAHATDRTTLQSQTADSLEQDIRKYEKQCEDFIAFKRTTLNNIGDHFSQLNKHAAEIDEMFPSRPGDETGEICQLRQRANEATKKIMRPTKYYFPDQSSTIQVRFEHGSASSLSQSSTQSSHPMATQGSVGAMQTKKPAQLQTIEPPAENEENSSSTQKPLRERVVDSDKIANAPCHNNDKGQPPAAKQSGSNVSKKRKRIEAKTIQIKNVKNAFIFEFPHSSSLLWILRCSDCNFQAKRNPLTATHNVIMHWNSKHDKRMKLEEIFESHLVQVIGGSIDEARKMNIAIGAVRKIECQPRRADAPPYAIPEFITSLLSSGKRQKRARDSASGELDNRPVNTRSGLAARRSKAVTEAVIKIAMPLRQQSTHNSPQPAYSTPAKSPNSSEFATLLRERPINIGLSTATAARDEPLPEVPSDLSPLDIVEPPGGDGIWVHRSARDEPRGPAPAYENGRDTAQYAGFNTTV